MIHIQFPQHPFKIKKQNNKEYIFDVFRKQWFLLTPEEWVRQNFLQYLVNQMQYPASLISVEREIIVAEMRKRFDIVVYKNAKPWMIVECKEMQVPLNDAVIKQILNYNITLQVEYLVITNGSATYATALKGKTHEWLKELPVYNMEEA